MSRPETVESNGGNGVVSGIPPEGGGKSAVGAVGARGILTPAVVVLTIGLIFVAVYLAAFHAPRPHHLPVAVVGSAQTARALQTDVNRVIPGGLKLNRVPNQSAALDAIEHRRAYGAMLAGNGDLTLLYAGANGPAVVSLLELTAGVTAKATRTSLRTRDILPATAGDSRSLSIFYAAFGLVLAGFLFGTMTYQVAPRLKLRQRLLSLLIFGVAGGLLIALIAKAFSAVPGPFLGLAGVIALMAMAAGGFSMSFVRIFGGAGASLAAVILLVLGNSTSGGVAPTHFLPAWLYPLSEILPVGPGVRALYGLAYFHDDGLITAVVVLIAWIVAAAAALYLRDAFDVRKHKAPAQCHVAAAPWGIRFSHSAAPVQASVAGNGARSSLTQSTESPH
jgi:hypothetical protein